MAPPDLPPPEVDAATLRERIGEALKSDSDFDAFCLSYFPGVHRRFSDGMDRVRKENILFEQTRGELGKVQQALDDHVARRARRRGATAVLSLAVLWHEHRWVAFAGSGFAGLIALAVLLWPKPPPTRGPAIPPIEPFDTGASGVVIGGPWVKAGKSERLLKELRAHDPERRPVHAVPYERGDSRDDFLNAARNAGAVVAVAIGDDDTAWVYPQGQAANDPLYRGPLKINVADGAEQQRAAALIDALARVAGPSRDFQPDTVPCPDLGSGTLGRAALLTLLVVPACWTALVDPRRFSDVCTGRSYEDETCALALYLDPSSSRETLEKLAKGGPERFRTVARLRLAGAYCNDGALDEATETVLGLSSDLDPCRQMQLPPIASCILARAGTRPARPELEAIEARQITKHAGCSERQRARALAQRAYWRSRRGQWQMAALEYGDAYELSKEPAHALDQAEAWLQQGALALAKKALDQLPAGSGGREQQAKTALLLWVAGRQAKNASWRTAAEGRLLGLIKGPEGEAALLGGEADDGLRELVCPPARGPASRRPAKGAGPPCLYDLLLRPASHEELKASLDAS